MNIYGEYITAKDHWARYGSALPFSSLKDLVRASNDMSMCETCGSNPVWRLVGSGMCFMCTTGEWDASGDIELIPTSKKAMRIEAERITNFIEDLKQSNMSHVHADALFSYHLSLIEKI